MQLITLNIWGGSIRDPLLNFIRDYQDIDIFCLQELYHAAENKISTDDRKVSLDIFAEIQKHLPDHTGFFRPTVRNIYGIGIFIKKDYAVLEEGEISIHANINYSGMGPDHSRNLQWLNLRHHNKTYTILNVHGLWNGMGKTDTPDRIAQSNRIKNFMNSLEHPKILCGDFNLRPDTKSLEIIAEGMTDLVKEHRITSTRTSFYPKPEKFADYIFVSKEISVKKFAALSDEVSDHAPLLLEFI